MSSFPGLLSCLGTCEFLLRLVGRIIFVIDAAILRKETIHEGIRYLFESDDEMKLLCYEYSNLNRLENYQTNSFEELQISPPDYSWGPIHIPTSNENENENENEEEDNICTRMMSEIATTNLKHPELSSTHCKLLPTIPSTDYSLRLSVGRVNHENYLSFLMSLKHFFTYVGLTTCLNLLLKYFSLHSDEEIRFDWKNNFPFSWEIWNRIFDLNKSTFLNTSISEEINKIHVRIPVNMASLRSYYPSFARLLGALGDTSININNAIATEMHLFTILYECDDPHRVSSPEGSLILTGLYNIHTGRLVWSNKLHPDVPYQSNHSSQTTSTTTSTSTSTTEKKFDEFVVDYPSLPFSSHINFDLGEDISSDMTEKDLIVTFVTSIRLHSLFGSWLPSIAFDDASFIIHPYKGYATNDSMIEIIGCIVRSLGFKANAGTASSTSTSHQDSNSHDTNHTPPSLPSSWLSHWSISHFITYGLESFIKIFQKTFLLSLYVNSPSSTSSSPSSSPSSLNSTITTTTTNNFFTLLFYFHLPEKSFLLTIFIHILKYLFLQLQVYLTTLNLLNDLFDSISKDLMRFHGGANKLEQENENDCSDEIERRVSWYCGNKEKIHELEAERNRQKQSEEASHHEENHSNTLLGSIGGYVSAGWNQLVGKRK